MTTRTSILAICMIFLSLQGQARPDRNICSKAYDAIPDKASVFKAGSAMLPFPDYSERDAWARLSEGYRDEIIANGEQALRYEWKVIKASEFLECKEDGNRNHLTIDRETKLAISKLALAELVEGKGRFIPHLIDGMMYEAERSTWQYAVHTDKQPSGKALGDPEERYITNGAAHTGQIMSVAWFFFHKEFDKIDPVISRTILNSIRKNILDPFLDDSKNATKSHFWMGMNEKRVKDADAAFANWTTYCTTQITTAFLLCEQDEDRLLDAMSKAMLLMDNYLDYAKMDGSCEEGPSYWGMAGGKVCEFARIIYDASDGRLDIIRDDQVRRIAEYKANISIGDGWEVNFADGTPRGNIDGLYDFNIGCDTGSELMKNYGLYLLAGKDGKFSRGSLDLNMPIRVLYTMKHWPLLKQAEEEALADAGGDWAAMRKHLSTLMTSTWYSDNHVAVFKSGSGWFIGAKGGNNGESHNHNDVGSGVVYVDECPVFIDLGCGTYRKDTFGKNRFKMFENISEGHNTVEINGYSQGTGKEFADRNVSCDMKTMTFRTDISGAYPSDAACRSWVRTWHMGKDGISINDRFELDRAAAGTDIHFLTNADVTLADGGVDLICRDFSGDRHVKVRMNVPKGLKVEVEDIPLTDPRHAKTFGPMVHRIVFTPAGNPAARGNYTFQVNRIK